MANDQRPAKDSLASQLGRGQQSLGRTPEDSKKWSQVIAQAWADEQFKARLMTAPAAVLQEHGIAIPPGTEVRVVENTEKVFYLTIPPKPSGEVTELTSDQLGEIAGGYCCLACSTPPIIIKLPEPPAYTEGVCMPSPTIGPV